jgi:DNA-binding transcriptional regulator YiaG
MMKKPKQMTAKQFNEIMDRWGMTQGAMAEFLGRSIRHVNGLANGDDIPTETQKLLRLMVRLKLKPEDVE